MRRNGLGRPKLQPRFEIKDRDLAGRIADLETKSGAIETPLLFPVVHPTRNILSAGEIQALGYDQIITNAYILNKHVATKAKREGIHRTLGFDGVIMTDSGAYQILSHGSVDADPREIIQFQEQVGSDIGVILDIPTRSDATQTEARRSVQETLKRARAAQSLISDSSTLWTGPVQGGTHLDLVETSATRMSRLSFDIYAIGSPTTVLMGYDYETLVGMIVAAKKRLPLDKPVHLFGAGHPMMFALAVALGCDAFDSASYGLFARASRYLTVGGTYRLSELETFPCPCRICESHSPSDIREMDSTEREKLIATHNLLVCAAEIRAIKQAIREGLLWEHLRTRCQAHPALLQAFKALCRHTAWIEQFDPVTKPTVHGLLHTSEEDSLRPKVLRHLQRLRNYRVPPNCRVLVLLPARGMVQNGRIKRLLRRISRLGEVNSDGSHFCMYEEPYGVIPLELREMFPLSQYERCSVFSKTAKENVARQVATYVEDHLSSYEHVYIVIDKDWADDFSRMTLNALKRLRIDVDALPMFTNDSTFGGKMKEK